jgi:hypothetical protein
MPMLMSRTNMCGPQFPISTRNKKMSQVTQHYGLLLLPLWLFGDRSGSCCIRCDRSGPPSRDRAHVSVPMIS